MTEETARKRRHFWVDREHDPRETDEPPGGETTILRQYLDRYRTTFEMKCEGLAPEQLAARSVPPSTMSLLGLVRHLAEMEHHWFRRTLEGHTDLPHLYHAEEAPGLDFDGAVGTEDCVADAWESWQREVAHSREVYARYDDLGGTFIPGEPWEVRGVIVHLIEEYARHCGHADLLRECIDGRTGQ
ncbi:MAG: DinB family protein [Nocardioides sp.]